MNIAQFYRNFCKKKTKEFLGLDDWKTSMLKSMLVNKGFQTLLLIVWQHSRQPIRSHVRKSMLTNMELNMDYIDGFVQKWHNFIVNALALRLSCINPLIFIDSGSLSVFYLCLSLSSSLEHSESSVANSTSTPESKRTWWSFPSLAELASAWGVPSTPSWRGSGGYAVLLRMPRVVTGCFSPSLNWPLMV